MSFFGSRRFRHTPSQEIPGSHVERCCWNKEHISAEECLFLRPGEQHLLLDRRRRLLQRCIECPRFLQNLPACGSGEDISSVIPLLIEELLGQKSRLHTLTGQMSARNREIKFLHDVGLVLQTSVGRDEVIAMALTAVTAGKGFGLNRAILLLVDQTAQTLVGYMAVGPRGQEEASHIWQEIEERDLTLKEMARHFYERKMAAEREKFRPLLDQLTTPLHRRDHLFVRTLEGQASRHIIDLSREPSLDPAQHEALGVEELILVPLINNSNRIGLLLADNFINRQPIAEEDMQSLETFALPVSFSIERAALYEQLQDDLDKITVANRQLKEQQDMILRMEKLAVAGRLAADLAHSIRNPLTIIGGFSRTLLKDTPPGHHRRHYLESMVRESRRLEAALQNVLAHNETLHPSFDLWDINRMLAGIYAGLREDLELCGIECRLILDPGLPPVRLDFKKMNHCLRCIIDHAMGELPHGGRVDIRTERQQEELLVVVRDSGPGLSEAEITSIFAPLEAAPGERPTSNLSLCARVLQEHGHGFQLHSRQGEGTTYTIRFQITQGDQS